MQTNELAGTHVVPIRVAGQATAGTADEFTGFVAPFNLTVTGAKWVPDVAITANGTNFFTLTLRNRGTAGAGSTQVASRSYAATNSVAMAPEDMTLSATAANLNVTAGEHVSVEKLVSGTGLAMPEGTVQVYYKLR